MHKKTIIGMLAFAVIFFGSIQYASANAPVVAASIKPVKIVQTSSGSNVYFVDFGEAYFGSLSFSLTSTASSQSVTVVVSEAASATNIVTTTTGCRSATSTQTMASGQKSFTLFSNQPFRAARITAPSAVTLDTASIVLATHYVPWDENAAAFTSSDTVLNRVWRLCTHTVKATSFMGVYIDGARETKPYEGDAYINMLTHFATDSNPEIALYTHEYLLTHQTWPWEYKVISVLIGWELYKQNGDLAQLKRNYVACQGKISGQIGTTSWSDADAMVDWPTTMRDGFVFTKGNTVTNSWAYAGLLAIADMADAIGKPTDATGYRTRAASIKKKINDSLYVKSQKAYRDGLGTQHVSLYSSLFPLAFGIVPDSLVKNVAAYIKTRGMICNVYPAQFLLDGLFDAGEDDYAIGLMNAKTGNSWGHMLYQVGATMCLEAWDPTQKPNLDWEHSWGAAAGNVIYRKMFGMVPLTPGYSHMMIKPQVGSLTSGSYKLPTVSGSVTVAFQSQKDASMTLNLTIPQKIVAKVYVPTYSISDNSVTVDGVKKTGTREGNFIYIDSIGVGSHVVSRSSSVGAHANSVLDKNVSSIRIGFKKQTLTILGIGNSLGQNAVASIVDCKGAIVNRFTCKKGQNDYTLKRGVGTYIVNVTKGNKLISSKKIVVGLN